MKPHVESKHEKNAIECVESFIMMQRMKPLNQLKSTISKITQP